MPSKPKVSKEVKRSEIQELKKAGWSPTEISKHLEVDRKTVYLWKDQSSITDKKRPGRPAKLSAIDKRVIKKKLYRNWEGSIRKTTVYLNNSKRNKDTGKKISRMREICL